MICLSSPLWKRKSVRVVVLERESACGGRVCFRECEWVREGVLERVSVSLKGREWVSIWERESTCGLVCLRDSYCVFERQREQVCVGVFEREWVCLWVGGRERVCVGVFEREWVSACVCVLECLRERDPFKAWHVSLSVFSCQLPTLTYYQQLRASK